MKKCIAVRDILVWDYNTEMCFWFCVRCVTVVTGVVSASCATFAPIFNLRSLTFRDMAVQSVHPSRVPWNVNVSRRTSWVLSCRALRWRQIFLECLDCLYLSTKTWRKSQLSGKDHLVLSVVWLWRDGCRCYKKAVRVRGEWWRPEGVRERGQDALQHQPRKRCEV